RGGPFLHPHPPGATASLHHCIVPPAQRTIPPAPHRGPARPATTAVRSTDPRLGARAPPGDRRALTRRSTPGRVPAPAWPLAPFHLAPNIPRGRGGGPPLRPCLQEPPATLDLRPASRHKPLSPPVPPTRTRIGCICAGRPLWGRPCSFSV